MNLKNDQILMVLNYLISVLMVFISSVFFLIFSTQLMLRKYENKEVHFIIQELWIYQVALHKIINILITTKH